jgi:tetratricopeptide (TPR) repeat protein
MTYQIPPPPAHFVNREEEQARTHRAVTEWDGEPDREPRPLVVSLKARAGTGKTELALRLARELRERFPQDVLYVDLDDMRREGVVEVSDALGELLRPLVGAESVEHSFGDRRKQWYNKTDGKRFIVVIDNARFGSEIEPLLPSSGTSLAIVTSHGPLHDLPAGAAVDLALPPLQDADALRLLQLTSGDPRLAAEPEATRSLVGLCSGLPAALHVAARWVRGHRRRPLTRLVSELTAELHDNGLPLTERVWDAAYRDLGPDAAALYRLLADCPGPSFTPAAAAAVLGRGRDAADDALEELETAGLLDARDVRNTGDERMRLPDLVRAHARRRAREDGSEEERTRGQSRVLRWYLRQAQRADRAAAGSRMTLAAPVAELDGAPDVAFGDPTAAEAALSEAQLAMRWLEAERHALFACVGLAYGRGLDAEAWALCEPLWTHFLDHRHYTDQIDAFRTGVAAAQRSGDIRTTVRMRCQLARPLWETGELEEAGREMRHALDACRALGGPDRDDDRKLGASAVEFHGMLLSAQGDWAAAAREFDTAREVHREIGNPYGFMLQTYRLGEALAELGALERAASLLASAHDLAREGGRERMTARTGFALGGVLRALGRGDEAAPLYEASLASAVRRGSESDEARVRAALAELAAEGGHSALAREHRAAAHAILERRGLAQAAPFGS